MTEEKIVQVCRLCQSTNLTTPCSKTKDGIHIAMEIKSELKGQPTVLREGEQSVDLAFMLKNDCIGINILRDKDNDELRGMELAYEGNFFVRITSQTQMFLEVQGPSKDNAKSV